MLGEGEGLLLNGRGGRHHQLIRPIIKSFVGPTPVADQGMLHTPRAGKHKRQLGIIGNYFMKWFQGDAHFHPILGAIPNMCGVPPFA